MKTSTALLLACLTFTPSCTSIGSAAMVPENVSVGRSHPGALRVRAKGTGRTLGVGAALVSGSNLERAVTEAIESSGLFGRVVSGDGSDWELGVTVLECELPSASLEMTAEAVIEWRLIGADGAPLWQDTIRTTSLATSDDASAFEDRGPMAVQGAVQKNIRRALVAIGGLQLEPR